MRATALTAFYLLVFAAASVDPAQARTDPDRPVMSAGPQAATTASGEFNCGTWRDTGRNLLWYESHRVARLEEMKAQGLSAAATMDSIHDDVWLIEDDGSLTITGTNLFDTNLTQFRFTPNGTGYDVTMVPYAIDLLFGEDLTMEDDADSVRALPFTFPFYGVGWDEIHIGSNGGIAFGAALNPSGLFDPDDFFGAAPKMTPYYMDLDPSTGSGTPAVYFRAQPESVVVFWAAINEYGSTRKNSFQIILRPDGTFDFVMISIASTAASTAAPFIMGIQPGGGAPLIQRISFSDDLPYSGAPGTGIYEDYLSLVNPMINETALGQRFYQRFPDVFFQYVFFTNFIQTMAGFANESNISNDVTGIGLPIFDNSALFGSNGVLESRCNMSRMGVWPSTNPAQRFLGTASQSFLTVMGQESAHRWGAFARFLDSGGQDSNMMLGRANAHWNYFADVDHSCLEGGNWVESGPGKYTCPDFVDKFCELDEYLMGLRTAAEVTDMYYVSSSTNDQEQNRSQPPPAAGTIEFGTPVPVTVEDFIAAEGPRTPLPSGENHDLRMAFMLVLRNGTTPTATDLTKITNFRRAWEDYFEVSCDGRLTCNTSLTQDFVPAVVEGHVVDKDTQVRLDDVVVFSKQRGFRQRVPDGGYYTFRYLENELSGTAETVTIVAHAFGYYPDSVTTSIDYGTGITLDFEMVRDPSVSVAITAFEARAHGGVVHLLARFASTYDAAVTVNVYRAEGDGGWTVIDRVSHAGGGDFHYVDDTAAVGRSYRYMIGVADADGEFYSLERRVSLPAASISLAQNVPNPFNPSTSISFSLSAREAVRIAVFAANGALVKTLVDGVRGPGKHTVEWNGTDDSGARVGSGVYFYRMSAGNHHETRKMLLLK